MIYIYLIYIYLIYIYEKSFLLGAIAVAALASCSNDDVVDVNKGEGISFRASLDKALTRPVISGSGCPVCAVIGRRDTQICEISGTVADGRHIERLQILQVCHVGTG